MAIPRFDLTTDTQVRVPTVNFAGAEASADAMLQLANNGFRLAQSGEQLVNASEQIYMDGLEVDIVTRMSEIEAKHQDDPEGLREAMGAYIDDVNDSVPFPFNGERLKNSLQKQAAQQYAQAVRSQAAKAKAQAAADSKARNELLELQIKNMGYPTDPLAKENYQKRVEMYQMGIASAVQKGVISEAQGMLQLAKFDSERLESKAQAFIGQDISKSSQAMMQVWAGTTGDAELDNMPMGEKRQLMAGALQIQNFQLNANSLVRTAKQEEMIAEWDNAYENLIANPDFALTPEGQTQMKQIVRTAYNTDSSRKVQKLMERVGNPTDPKYRTTDEGARNNVENRLSQGTLTFEYLDEMHGNGLSTTAYGEYRKQLAELNTTLYNRGVYQQGKQQLDAITNGQMREAYRVKYKSLTGREPEALPQEITANSILSDLRTQWVNGGMEKSDKAISDHFQNRKNAAMQVKQEPPADPGEEVARKDSRIVQKAQSYKTREDIMADFKAGQITKAEALRLYKLVKEKQNGK